MTDSPEIDFDHLNQYVGGDADLTREVFGLFRNQVEMWGKGLTADADDDMWAAREVAVETLEHRISQVLSEIVRWEYKDDMRSLRSS